MLTGSIGVEDSQADGFDAPQTADCTDVVFRCQFGYRVRRAGIGRHRLAQRLLPRADGLGRVPAVEVMIATAFIRDCVIDKDRTSQIHSAIASGTSQYGMQTFDQSIFSLYSQGLITLDEALRWATNVDEFKLKVQGISTTSDLSRDQMAGSVFGKPSAPPAPTPGRPAVPEITRFGK